MTKFTTLDIGQADDGTGVTANTTSPVGFTRTVDVSSGNTWKNTITLPDNSGISSITEFGQEAYASGAATLNVGDTVSAAKYMNGISVSAVSARTGTLKVAALSAKTIIVQATASALVSGASRVVLGCFRTS